jgi:hypothetical protein
MTLGENAMEEFYAAMAKAIEGAPDGTTARALRAVLAGAQSVEFAAQVPAVAPDAPAPSGE